VALTSQEQGGADRNSDAPMVPLIINAVRARASVGEISDTLAARWGLHTARG
jgi:hypothetical protein